MTVAPEAETAAATAQAPAAPRRSTASGRNLLRTNPRRLGKHTQSGASLILGLIGAAVVGNWLQGGPGQVWQWLGAKLANKTSPTAHYTPFHPLAPPPKGSTGTPPGNLPTIPGLPPGAGQSGTG